MVCNGNSVIYSYDMTRDVYNMSTICLQYVVYFYFYVYFYYHAIERITPDKIVSQESVSYYSWKNVVRQSE